MSTCVHLGWGENVNLTGPVPSEVWELAAVEVLDAQPSTSPLWPKCFFVINIFLMNCRFLYPEPVKNRAPAVGMEVCLSGTLLSSQLSLSFV